MGPPRRRFINTSSEEMLSRTVLQKSAIDTVRSSGRVELVSSPPDALLPRARRSARPAPPSLDLRRAITGEEQAPGSPFPSLPFPSSCGCNASPCPNAKASSFFSSSSSGRKRVFRFSLQFVRWIRSLPRVKDPRILSADVS